MLKLTERLGAQSGPVNDELVLDFDRRKRGRLLTRTKLGQEVGLFLDRGQALRDGDCLRAESGEVFRVRSSLEAVVTAWCQDAVLFARACYHLGNRHVPLQVGDKWLRFKPDHVLVDLVKSLGLHAADELAPFEPEDGAYGKHSHHTH